MGISNGIFNSRDPYADQRMFNRSPVLLIGNLLSLCDFASVLLAAYSANVAYFNVVIPAAGLARAWDLDSRLALAAAVLAPMILRDRAFGVFDNTGKPKALMLSFALRFLMLSAIVGAIGLASHSLRHLPHAWLALWFVSSMTLTALTRLLLFCNLRRLERNGVLRESVAVIGAGPLADRLIAHLQHTRGNHIHILGVFDDRYGRSHESRHQPIGSIADLIELGKSRSMDWILLTLPGTATSRLKVLVHRLKALAVPVGLCPQQAGFATAGGGLQYFGGARVSAGLGDQPASRWNATLAIVESFLPRWILSALSLPALAVESIFTGALKRKPAHTRLRAKKLVFTMDDYDIGSFLPIAAQFGQSRFGYVVTPNADHLIRLHREHSFRALYSDATYVLLDSRFIAHLLRLTQKLHLPVCTGSDLTAKLLQQVIRPDDKLLLIGGSAAQVEYLKQRFGLKRLVHHNPPMGFIRDQKAMECCLRFIEANSPFRYCLLAVGAPQQEVIAQRLKLRGIARGMALCIGASINYLTGEERRAPLWMQASGLEWLFRLSQAPGRMSQRYLVRGPQLFGMLRNTEIVLRAACATAGKSDATVVFPIRSIVAPSALKPAVAHLATSNTANEREAKQDIA